MSEAIHRCTKFRAERRDGPWRDCGGSGLREREVYRVELCVECSKERRKRVRRATAIEREARLGLDLAVLDSAQRKLAFRLDYLFRDRERVRVGPLIRKLGGIRSELDLEVLAEQTPLRLIYKPHAGSLDLEQVVVLDARAFAERLRPGVLARRRAALEKARAAAADLSSAEARGIAAYLERESAEALDEQAIAVLSALAELVELGDVSPARAFSARVLGDSKALARIRRRVERWVGPLERLGIREAGALVVAGGSGRVKLGRAHAIDLAELGHVGLPAHEVLASLALEVPSNGVIVVENLTPFEACAERAAARGDTMIIWSAGFPGRAIRMMIARAVQAAARVRVWCDLDLGGARIARLVDRVARAEGAQAELLGMEPERVAGAKILKPLDSDQRRDVARDLAERPDGLGSDMLRVVLERGAWVEQETLIDDVLGEL